LRAEVPVEDRLRDAGLTGDLRGRRAAVALAEERLAGRVEHGLPALHGGEARPGRGGELRHASASTEACPGSGCGAFLRVRTPRSIAGSRPQNVSSAPILEKRNIEPASPVIPKPTRPREPIRSESRPAGGASAMISSVQGRNDAPAWIGE